MHRGNLGDHLSSHCDSLFLLSLNFGQVNILSETTFKYWVAKQLDVSFEYHSRGYLR